MTHDWSHLDDALDAHLREEAERPTYDAPYVSGDSVDNTCLDGWFDLGGMRKAILSALTPSDLAALLAEKCPGWVIARKLNRDTIRQMGADAVLYNGELPQSTEDMWGFFEWFYETITPNEIGEDN